MIYRKTTATDKLLKLKKRIRGVSGGTGASKTVSIMLILIDYAQTHPGKLISVTSETLPHLKRGARRDFLNIMQGHNYFEEARWNRTDSIYTFENDAAIEFFSADNAYKVRGPRRDVLFVNEANNISYETYNQLEIRTNDIIWLDWNPVQEFWFYTDVKPDNPEVDFLTLTYKDNEALPDTIVKSIESRRSNEQWFKVYGLGELGVAEGRIYKDWEVISSIPHEARLERYGVDFGYTNDPTAIIAVYYYNGGYILDEVAYQKGLSNKQIADIILSKQQALTIADSAEPKSIDEIRSYGVSILPASKGQDSIRNGIQAIQNQRISVTARSLNLLKEYRNYLWETNSDGTTVNVPIDIFNHAMDAIRYAMDNLKVVEKFIDPNQFNPEYGDDAW